MRTIVALAMNLSPSSDHAFTEHRFEQFNSGVINDPDDDLHHIVLHSYIRIDDSKNVFNIISG